MPLHTSGENYLKTIYLLQKKQGAVREYEIAEMMGYSRPSVSRMIKMLEQQGYVTVGDHNVILTDAGVSMAEHIYEKYETLCTCLTEVLGIEESVAKREACRLEHAAGPETMEAIKKILEER